MTRRMYAISAAATAVAYIGSIAAVLWRKRWG